MCLDLLCNICIVLQRIPSLPWSLFSFIENPQVVFGLRWYTGLYDTWYWISHTAELETGAPGNRSDPYQNFNITFDHVKVWWCVKERCRTGNEGLSSTENTTVKTSQVKIKRNTNCSNFPTSFSSNYSL